MYFVDNHDITWTYVRIDEYDIQVVCPFPGNGGKEKSKCLLSLLVFQAC